MIFNTTSSFKQSCFTMADNHMLSWFIGLLCVWFNAWSLRTVTTYTWSSRQSQHISTCLFFFFWRFPREAKAISVMENCVIKKNAYFNYPLIWTDFIYFCRANEATFKTSIVRKVSELVGLLNRLGYENLAKLCFHFQQALWIQYKLENASQIKKQKEECMLNEEIFCCLFILTSSR